MKATVSYLLMLQNYINSKHNVFFEGAIFKIYFFRDQF